MSFFNATKKVAAVLGFAAGSVFARGLLLAATAVGAVLMFGCGGDDNPGGGGAISDRWINGAPLTYGNQTYRTVKIGGQTWMAENLNIETENSYCYGNSADSCAKYGRLYNWGAAMSACPSGWHLPDSAEWNALVRYVGGSEVAGTRLKSTTGWDSYNSGKTHGNGTDNYGFSALPGGIRSEGGSGGYAGSRGGWISATHRGSSRSVYNLVIYNHSEVINRDFDIGVVEYFYSVRCVEGAAPSTEISYTATFNANGGTVSPTTATTGTDGKLASLPTPVRDGYTFDGWFTAATGGTAVTTNTVFTGNTTIYAQWTVISTTPGGGNNCTNAAACKQVTIGTQVWMGENLNIATSSGSWCYNDDNSNCAKYGRLYDWETAMTVCPSGWHLPSNAEWGDLVTAAGGSSMAGGKLKSTSGWSSENGTDDYGFSALPGGGRNTVGSFNYVGDSGIWWTATEYGGGGAYRRGMNYYGDDVYENSDNKEDGFSVRCLRD